MVESSALEVPSCVMNESVKAFEPEIDDIFVVLDSGDYQRLIFKGQALREKEETKMQEFRDFCKENSLVLPEGYDDDGRILLRFL